MNSQHKLNRDRLFARRLNLGLATVRSQRAGLSIPIPDVAIKRSANGKNYIPSTSTFAWQSGFIRW